MFTTIPRSTPRSHVGRLGAAAAALALAATGTVAALPAHAAGAPGCTNADLVASYAGGNGAAGTIYGRIVLRNVSGHACRTGGYAGISYVGDGNGTQIGAPAVRRDRAAVASYVLQPGQRVRSVIGETEALNYPRSRCRPAHVDGFRIYVPDSTRAQYVVHPTTGCLNHHVKLISTRPLRRP